jgi:hypothetical protein
MPNTEILASVPPLLDANWDPAVMQNTRYDADHYNPSVWHMYLKSVC